jgi:hypothetical protein
MMSKEIMQQALDALKYHQEQTRPIYQTGVVIESLESELAKPEQPDLRKAADMALYALENNLPLIEDYGSKEHLNIHHESIMALYKTLAQPEQEPVCNKDPQGCWSIRCQLGKICKNTAPPRKEWQGLTQEERDELLNGSTRIPSRLIDWVEQKLKDKNNAV